MAWCQYSNGGNFGLHGSVTPWIIFSSLLSDTSKRLFLLFLHPRPQVCAPRTIIPMKANSDSGVFLFNFFNLHGVCYRVMDTKGKCSLSLGYDPTSKYHASFKLTVLWFWAAILLQSFEKVTSKQWYDFFFSISASGPKGLNGAYGFSVTYVGRNGSASDRGSHLIGLPVHDTVDIEPGGKTGPTSVPGPDRTNYGSSLPQLSTIQIKACN